MKFLAALLFIGLIALGCKSNDSSDQVTKRLTVSTTANWRVDNETAKVNRAKEFDKFLSAAQLVAETTKDAEATGLLTFFKKFGTYQETLPATMPEFDQKMSPHFEVFALIDSDEEEWAKGFLKDPLAVANCLPARQAMILRFADNYSPLFRGTIVLHETRHAHTYLQVHPDWAQAWATTSGQVNPKLYCYDEAETHVFQFRLFQKIGGAKYNALLETVISRMISRAPEPLAGLYDISRHTPAKPPQYPSLMFSYQSPEELQPVLVALDEIFGPCQSNKEKICRLSLLDINANFVLADRYAKDPLDSKATFLLILYKKNEDFQKGQ